MFKVVLSLQPVNEYMHHMSSSKTAPSRLESGEMVVPRFCPFESMYLLICCSVSDMGKRVGVAKH
jgi:hypothetical protein